VLRTRREGSMADPMRPAGTGMAAVGAGHNSHPPRTVFLRAKILFQARSCFNKQMSRDRCIRLWTSAPGVRPHETGTRVDRPRVRSAVFRILIAVAAVPHLGGKAPR